MSVENDPENGSKMSPPVKNDESIDEIGDSDCQKDVGNCPAFPDSDSEMGEVQDGMQVENQEVIVISSEDDEPLTEDNHIEISRWVEQLRGSFNY